MAQNDRNKIAQKVCKRRFFDFGLEKFENGQKPSFLTKNDQKMKIFENFWSKKFFSESIQNVLKRILKRKSRNRKFFPV